MVSALYSGRIESSFFRGITTQWSCSRMCKKNQIISALLDCIPQYTTVQVLLAMQYADLITIKSDLIVQYIIVIFCLLQYHCCGLYLNFVNTVWAVQKLCHA